MAKRKPKTTAKLINEAAELNQKLVRLKAANEEGYCNCVTCGALKHWKELQGGHFIERGKSYSKLMEENVHPQCQYCNAFGMKNASTVLAYRRYMVDMYGEDFVTELEDKARENAPIKRYKTEMVVMIADLKGQIKIQYERLGEG